MRSKMVIYTAETGKLKEYKELFKEIAKESGKLTEGYFSVPSKTILKNPSNLQERLFNYHQERSYNEGIDLNIYSFNI